MPSENFWHKIFSAENTNTENFSHKLFAIETNVNENKANYGISNIHVHPGVFKLCVIKKEDKQKKIFLFDFLTLINASGTLGVGFRIQ